MIRTSFAFYVIAQNEIVIIGSNMKRCFCPFYEKEPLFSGSWRFSYQYVP